MTKRIKLELTEDQVELVILALRHSFYELPIEKRTQEAWNYTARIISKLEQN